MAVVYRATAPTADGARPVVIKRVLPELSRDPVFIKMLVAEARLSSRLNHPGIVQTHELGRVGDEYFLAMEYVDGVDLVRLLNRCVATRTRPPVGVVCHVAEKVAAALAYAHALADAEGRALEIVHRDVSPANIMVTLDGQVKLLDFGVAKAAEHVRDEHTRTGTLKGKINYLSPEQADGQAIDRRSDLFALGIVLHEALTLKRLFRGPSDLVTLRLVRQCEVRPPSWLRPDVPPELDAIVLKMLARDPRERFQSGEEIATALAPLAAAREGTAEALAAFVASLQPFAPAPPEREREVTLEADAEEDEATMPDALATRLADDEATAPDALAAKVAREAALRAAGPSDSVIVEIQAPVEPAAETKPATSEAVRVTDDVAVPRWRRRAAAIVAPALMVLAAAAVWRAVPRRAVDKPPPAAIATAAPTPPRAAPTPSAPAPVATAAKVAPAPSVAAPVPSSAHLVVDVDAPAAQIRLDGALVANAAHRARIAVERPGTHRLEVSAPRRHPWTRDIVIGAGAELDVKVRLARAPSAFQRAKVKTTDGDYLVDPFKR